MRKTNYIEEEERDEIIDPNEECELCGGPLDEWGLCSKCDYPEDANDFDDDELQELDFDR